jgi:hypothetical protein
MTDMSGLELASPKLETLLFAYETRRIRRKRNMARVLHSMFGMNTTTNATKSTIEPFKSMRAAKMAYTKAERAWKEMCSIETSLIWERRRKMEENDGSMEATEYDDYSVKIEAAEKAAPALFEKMREIYNQAESQWKYSMPTWHFGNNPTRDLIAMNMD